MPDPAERPGNVRSIRPAPRPAEPFRPEPGAFDLHWNALCLPDTRRWAVCGTAPDTRVPEVGIEVRRESVGAAAEDVAHLVAYLLNQADPGEVALMFVSGHFEDQEDHL